MFKELGSHYIYIAIAALLVVGIAILHVDVSLGSFPTPGITSDGMAALRPGDPIFVRGRSNRSLVPGRVVKLVDAGVQFKEDNISADSTAGREAILPLQGVPPRTWIKVAADHCRQFVPAESITAAGFTVRCDGKTLPIPFDEAAIPDPDDLNHAFRWAAIPWLLLVAAIILLIAVTRAVDSSEQRKSAAEKDLEKARADAESRAAELSVVASASVPTCTNCGAPVALVSESTTLCAVCGGQVTIPISFVELARARDENAKTTQLAARALHRALALTHPLVSVALVGIAVALGWTFRHLIHLSEVARWDSLLSSLELLWGICFMIPLGLVVAALSQLGQYMELRGVRLDFAPVPGPGGKGWACRNCGAPLVSTEPGLGEPCAFCRAENLIYPLVEGATRQKKKDTSALAETVRFARATAANTLLRAAGVPAIAMLRVLAPSLAFLAIVSLSLGLIMR